MRKYLLPIWRSYLHLLRYLSPTRPASAGMMHTTVQGKNTPLKHSTVPEGIKTGVTFTASERDKKQEQRPIVRMNTGTPDLFRVAFPANWQHNASPLDALIGWTEPHEPLPSTWW